MGAGVTSGECSPENTFNITEEKVAGYMYRPLDVQMITIYMPIIWSFGVIMNLSFLFVVYRVRTMRSETNIYLANLALSDILFLVMSSILYLSEYGASSVIFHSAFTSSVHCSVFFTLLITSYFTSISLVTMVTYERFLALCHPMRHLKMRGWRRTYKMVGVCWALGLSLAGSVVPNWAFFTKQCVTWPDDERYADFPSVRAHCGAVQPWVKYYAIPLRNIPWFLALAANVYMYARIIYTLSGRNCSDGKSDNKLAQQVRNQVAKMLVVNGVVFFLCQTPYSVRDSTNWICDVADLPNPLTAALGYAAKWLANVPTFVNSSINPLIYSVMSAQYRAAVRQAFRRRRPPQHSASFPTASISQTGLADDDASMETVAKKRQPKDDTAI